MGIQLRPHYQHHLHVTTAATQLSSFLSSSSNSPPDSYSPVNGNKTHNGQKTVFGVERPLDLSNYVHKPIQRRGSRMQSSSSAAPPIWDGWVPDKDSKAAPSLSDILWPSAGAFAAMAVLGKMDQMLAPKGLCMTIAPLGAVSAVLFTTPSSPAARKYNMFMAQIGCAAIGVLALTIFGPGWLARSTGLAAAVAFMIYTRCVHPPAASLPLLFIDGAKLHHLNFWYAFFPSATGCILLCLIQEMVIYLKDKFKF